MPWSRKDLPPAVKNKDWSDHQIDTFIAAANAALKEYGDDGKAIATGIAAAEKAGGKSNSVSQHPKRYICRHMQPGTARYEDETILVDTDGMKNLINSLNADKAIPVYVGHRDVDIKNIKDQADGYVTRSFYNALDGWAYFEFLAVDDRAHEAIRKGWRVSNAYMPTEWGPKGTKNNVPYDREMRNGEFTHLAIVPDPRYEGAMIYTPEEFKAYQDGLRNKLEVTNSKGKKSMFKFFNRTETDTPNDDSLVDIGDGKLVPWKEVKNALEEEDKKAKSKVVINGKEMTLEEAAEKYRQLENAKKKTKKNGESEMKEDPDEEEVDGDQDSEGDDEIGEGKRNAGKKKGKRNEKKNGEDCYHEDGMENSEDEDEDDKEDGKKKENKKEKKNSTVDVDKDDDYFREMRNAHNRQEQQSVVAVTCSIDQLERGKQRYGSGK